MVEQLKPTWNHQVCTDCWMKDPEWGNLQDTPNGITFRIPVVVRQDWEKPILGQCCICNAATFSGIFVRLNPQTPYLQCGGLHADGEE